MYLASENFLDRKEYRSLVFHDLKVKWAYEENNHLRLRTCRVLSSGEVKTQHKKKEPWHRDVIEMWIMGNHYVIKA